MVNAFALGSFVVDDISGHDESFLMTVSDESFNDSVRLRFNFEAGEIESTSSVSITLSELNRMYEMIGRVLVSKGILVDECDTSCDSCQNEQQTGKVTDFDVRFEVALRATKVLPGRQDGFSLEEFLTIAGFDDDNATRSLVGKRLKAEGYSRHRVTIGGLRVSMYSIEDVGTGEESIQQMVRAAIESDVVVIPGPYKFISVTDNEDSKNIESIQPKFVESSNPIQVQEVKDDNTVQSVPVEPEQNVLFGDIANAPNFKPCKDPVCPVCRYVDALSL